MNNSRKLDLTANPALPEHGFQKLTEAIRAESNARLIDQKCPSPNHRSATFIGQPISFPLTRPEHSIQLLPLDAEIDQTESQLSTSCSSTWISLRSSRMLFVAVHVAFASLVWCSPLRPLNVPLWIAAVYEAG
jgi:hypothetical protein